MAVDTEIACTCASIGADPSIVRLSECHHRYWRGDKELTSVTRIIKETWPIPPDFSKADPAVLENARDRGIVVDQLFSAYVKGKLDRIPAGTRQDAVNLFMKLKRWWDNNGGHPEETMSQVILADEEIAGTCDVLTSSDRIYDVKATYNVEKFYPLQLGAYADLYESIHGRVPELFILHVTERFPEPKVIELPISCYYDWQTLKAMWTMVQRLK